MTTIRDKLLDMTGLRTAVGAVAKEHKRLTSSLGSLKRTRAEIAAAPVNRADLIAAVAEWVDDQAAEYRKALGERLSNIGRDTTNIECGIGAASPRPWQRALFGLDVSPHHAPDGEGVMPGALVLMVGADGIKAALRREIEALEIDGEGLPLQQRQAELEKLDKQIEDIESQLAEMRKEAAAAGVRLDREATA